METLLKYADIIIRKDAENLYLDNSLISRVLNLTSGAPRTVSLKDKNGREFADSAKAEADLSFIGMGRPEIEDMPWHIEGIEAEVVPGDIFDGEKVRVAITMLEPVEQNKYLREYFIYPNQPLIAVQNAVESMVMPNIYWTRREGQRPMQDMPHNYPKLESCADSIKPAAGIHPAMTVEFTGITDHYDDLVKIHPVNGELMNGNIMLCQGGDGAGFMYLQEAPPSGERRDFETYDFRIGDGTVYSCNWGISPWEIAPGVRFQGYRHVLILFHSVPERDLLLKNYLKSRFPQDPDKNYSVMVNPWGCGCFPKLVNEQFLLDEIAAAPEVGATHYQVDDAWQTGGALSEITRKNRKITPDFWTISEERLQGSFDSIIDAAKKSGVEPALWMAPSTNCEYRDWREFAAVVLELHRKYGFNMFKIDAMRIRSYEAETNLRQMLQYIRKESNGEVYFNLDTTNGQRPGYFSFLEYGNIFLENRYVCHQWGLGYHPEKTLRSLWRLSRFMRPQLLQIEIPSPEDINPEFYQDKPWADLKGYPVEYWAAVAFFANPLLWFAPSRMSAPMRERIKAIMNLHCEYRKRIFSGEIFAVGEEPDGQAIAGLHSHNFADNTGMLILYREFGNTEGKAVIKLNYLPKTLQWQRIFGEGEIRFIRPGEIQITIPARPGFVIYSY